jgi:hypothetical protein
MIVQSLTLYWTHSGLGKYASKSTDEREIIREPEITECENGPTDDSAQSLSSKDVSNAPHAPPSTSDEDKAAMLKEYDRLSSQSRKNWNAAAHIGDGDAATDGSGTESMGKT